MKKRVIYLMLLILISVTMEAGIRRQLTEKAEMNKIEKQWAVLIGISKYREWNSLKNPSNDLKETKEILERKFYIDEYLELYDEQATAENIRKTFEKIRNEAGVHDSVLVYYAGHGGYSEVTGSGYWIPHDGGKDGYKMQNWIPVSELKSYFQRLKSRHVFLIADACYSGELIDMERGKPEEIDNDYLRKGYSKIARQIMISGAEEKVSDNSEFARSIKAELEGNLRQLLDPTSLFEKVKQGVKKTTPLVGSIEGTGHQGGASFVMFAKSKEDEEVVVKAREEKKKKEEFERKPYSYIFADYGNISLMDSHLGKLIESNNFTIQAGYRSSWEFIKYDAEIFFGDFKARPEYTVQVPVPETKPASTPAKTTTTTKGAVTTTKAAVVTTAQAVNVVRMYGVAGSVNCELLNLNRVVSLYTGLGGKLAITEQLENGSNLYLKTGADIMLWNVVVGVDYKYGIYRFNDSGQLSVSVGWGWK